MKLKLISSLSIFFISLLLEVSLFAQEQDIVKLPPITIRANTNVSAKVSQAFNHYFKDAQDVKWHEMDEKFLVKFISNDLQNTALFRKNGYLIYHVIWGKEKNLPADIRWIIKTNSDYFDYNITNVFNVNQDKRNIWVAYLEDSKNLIIVRIEDYELEEVHHIKKSL